MKTVIRLAMAATLALAATPVLAQMAPIEHATFNAAGEAVQPTGYRKWVFVGAPLTPHALNDGAAPFPEYHNVYVEPTAFAHFEKTGEWPEGTQIVKELTLIYQNDNDEIGATFEVSGHGYQQGEFSGLELTVKETKRFPDMAGGWAYFSFGHHAPPYAATAAAFPADACNACHEANAETDFVFTQFYPVIRAANPKK